MFDNIARRYDFLNHFLSLGIDRFWRKSLIRQARTYSPERILDVATGTGDLAIALAGLKNVRITGVDISEGMLDIGKEKVRNKNLEKIIELQKGDAEALPFSDGSFHLVTAAFGVRNFEDLSCGLKEMNRVLKPGGHVLILEFSTIRNPIWKGLFKLYFRGMLPLFGRIISRHSFAYTYLPESVGQFPYGDEFLGLLKSSGFEETRQKRLSGGIATLYSAEKK